MSEMQITDESPENYSGGNSATNNLKSSNYYYTSNKSKKSSSLKLTNIKETDSNISMGETGVSRLLKDPKLVSLYSAMNCIAI